MNVIILTLCSFNVPPADVLCVNKKYFSVSSNKLMITFHSHDISHRGQHLASWLSSLCFSKRIHLYLISVKIFSILRMSDDRYKHILFSSSCLRIFPSIHFLYLINKLFVLIDYLQPLCYNKHTLSHTMLFHIFI